MKVEDKELSEVKEIRGEVFRVSRFNVEDLVCHQLPHWDACDRVRA